MRGLEIMLARPLSLSLVHHHMRGLEKTKNGLFQSVVVHHHMRGLENMAAATSSIPVSNATSLKWLTFKQGATVYVFP